MNFNSLYQLYAMKRDKSSLLAAAKEALFIPDALSYMLTGKKVVEYTIASTSQMLNPRTKKFEKELLEKMGVDPELFGQIVMPGYVIGELTDTLASETGLARFRSSLSPDTIPLRPSPPFPAKKREVRLPEFRNLVADGYRGERPDHHRGDDAPEHYQRGWRRGHDRLLKNITGMWILEQCIKEWKKEAIEYTYPEIVKMARDAEPFQSFIDPDDASFAIPKAATRQHKEFDPRVAREPRKL